MKRSARGWAIVVGGAVSLLLGCAADVPSQQADLSGSLLDPSAPLGVDDEGPFVVPVDAGERVDAGRPHDIPGRADDRTPVDGVPYGSFNEHLPMRCGGGEACPEGSVCCPATQRCVPASCPGCCSADDYYRFTPIEPIDPGHVPHGNPAGPPPGGPTPEGPPGHPQDPDPGPMPPPPSAP